MTPGTAGWGGAADVLHKAGALHSDEAHHAQRLLVLSGGGKRKPTPSQHIDAYKDFIRKIDITIYQLYKYILS